MHRPGARNMAGTAALKLGWRFGVWAPGIIALAISSAVVAIVRDSPESLGRIGAYASRPERAKTPRVPPPRPRKEAPFARGPLT